MEHRFNWSGKVKFEFREDKDNVKDNSYYLWFGDIMVCSFPPSDASYQWQNRQLYKDVENIFNVDLSQELPEVVKQWNGEIVIKQIRDTPLFELFINDKSINKFSVRSPLGQWVEKIGKIDLIEWVKEEWQEPSVHYDWSTDKKQKTREEYIIRKKEQKQKGNEEKIKELFDQEESAVAACWIESAKNNLIKAMVSTAGVSYETAAKIHVLVKDCEKLIKDATI